MAVFSDLPPEVRNIMYEKLLRGESKPQSCEPNELAIFTVSKELHSESSSYFYNHNDISINAPSATTNTATILPPIADQYLRFLRRLTVRTLTGRASMPQTQQVGTAIAGLSGINAEFNELTLLIESSLSHILNSRVDDSIMNGTHPITVAIRAVLKSNVAKILRIELKNAWFAPGVAHALHTDFGSQLQFMVNGMLVQDVSTLERLATGRHSSSHLAALGLDEADVASITCHSTSSPLSTPTSLPSSFCSTFADLDTFSVTSYHLGSEDNKDGNSNESLKEDVFTGFFSEEDIEEWSASAQEELEYEEESTEDTYYLDDDEEMEDVPQEEVQAFMNNMEDIAHHVANETDVTYMTNFAPDLLLSRHHLGHLV
jgi:hypothetical protein